MRTRAGSDTASQEKAQQAAPNQIGQQHRASRAVVCGGCRLQQPPPGCRAAHSTDAHQSDFLDRRSDSGAGATGHQADTRRLVGVLRVCRYEVSAA